MRLSVRGGNLKDKPASGSGSAKIHRCMFKYSANVLRVIRHFGKFLLTQQWIVTCLKIYQLIFLDVKNRHRQDRNLNTDQTRCFLPNRRRSRERGCQTSGPVAGTSLEWQPLTFTGPEVSPRPADTSTQAQVRHTLHVCVCVCVRRVRSSHSPNSSINHNESPSGGWSQVTVRLWTSCQLQTHKSKVWQQRVTALM